MKQDPPFITVTQAAERLQISRTLAYELARRYLLTGGREGIPVVRLGERVLRVIVAELDALGHRNGTGNGSPEAPSDRQP